MGSQSDSIQIDLDGSQEEGVLSASPENNRVSKRQAKRAAKAASDAAAAAACGSPDLVQLQDLILVPVAVAGP